MSSLSALLVVKKKRKPIRMSTKDVYTYSPKEYHCTEGLAIENDRGLLIDWFWGGDVVSHRQYVDRDAEDLKLIANLNDYELTPRDGRESNCNYAPEDRLVITSQHGLQQTFYIRKGSIMDLATRIKNACERLEEAQSEMRSAQRRVEYAQEALNEIEKEKSNID